MSNLDIISLLLLERIASHLVVAVESLPETTRGTQWFGSLGLNALDEYAHIPSAAASGISLESVNILDHFEGTFDQNFYVY